MLDVASPHAAQVVAQGTAFAALAADVRPYFTEATCEPGAVIIEVRSASASALLWLMVCRGFALSAMASNLLRLSLCCGFALLWLSALLWLPLCCSFRSALASAVLWLLSFYMLVRASALADIAKTCNGLRQQNLSGVHVCVLY